MAFDRVRDARVRGATFDWLASQVDQHGDVLPRGLLETGFQLDSARVTLVGPAGIWKPAQLVGAPLSIATVPDGPYYDAFGSDGLLQYSYQGKDPNSRHNQMMMVAMQRKLPLAYFQGLVPGKYVAAWPVFVVGADPIRLKFSVAVDDAHYAGLSLLDAHPQVGEPAADERRRYVTAVVRKRLHQRAFRERVLNAYRRECTFCRFKHSELLDAAHIAGDREPEGEPRVQNGLSLCTIHHAAFDRYFLGVTPDYVIRVRPDLLGEEDGPTLVHSIQALDGRRMRLPRREEHHPSRDLLDLRFQRFLSRAQELAG